MLEPLDDGVVVDLLELCYLDDEVVLSELLDVDDLVVLIELLYLHVLDVHFMILVLDVLAEPELPYVDVAAAQFELLGVLDEFVDLVGQVVGCRCQYLMS